MLDEYYPWENEPIDKKRAIEILWNNARNPLAHSLGLYSSKRAESAVIFSKRALSIAEINQIESSDSRPEWLPPTIQSRTDFSGYDVNVISLYWGTCKLIRNLLHDRNQTISSETLLRHLIFDYDIRWIETELPRLEHLPRDSSDYRKTVANIRALLNKLKTLRFLHPSQKAEIRRKLKNTKDFFDVLP